MLLWHATPRQAFEVAIALNDRWQLDGRDPNGWMGVAWCFERYDEPFGDRAIFGAVRPMTTAGLRSKTNVDGYIAWVERGCRRHLLRTAM